MTKHAHRIERFRNFLIDETGCQVNKNYWPCGTCTRHYAQTIGMDPVKFWHEVLNVRVAEKGEGKNE